MTPYARNEKAVDFILLKFKIKFLIIHQVAIDMQIYSLLFKYKNIEVMGLISVNAMCLLILMQIK